MMQRLTLTGSALALASLVGMGNALAQESEGSTDAAAPATSEEPASKIDLGVPPKPGPAVPRSYHVHRGFYLSGEAGIGYMNATFDNGVSLGAEGFNLNLSLLVGHQVGEGLALGGGGIVDLTAGASFENAGVSTGDSTIFNVLVGPFIDAYPKPNGSWRMGGAVGFAALGASPGTSSITAFGPGFSAWLGYTPWVSDHLSIGVSGRFVGTIGFGDDEGSTRSINLVLSAVYF